MAPVRDRLLGTSRSLGLRRSPRIARVLRPAPRGLLRRRGPVSLNWGFDRGTPIDRYFIERFLDESGDAIRGRVLEVKDDEYTRAYGRGVTAAEVLDVDAGNPLATVVADLTDASGVADASYDCLIVTQTLHLIYDLHAAIRECRRILRPGGTLLVTVPALSRCSRELQHSDFWRMTPTGARRAFGDVFGADNVHVEGHGSAVLSAAFLMGVAAEEVSRRTLGQHDPLFPLVVTIRATKVD